MKIDYLYAAIFVADIDASTSFYAKVLGRAPDDRPMPNLVQWRGFSAAGIQLFEDAKKAGNGTITLVVADIAEARSLLQAQGIDLGEEQSGDYGKIARLSDPDGNNLTFAEPPKRPFRSA